jgi:hypothetical protein
VLSGMLANYNPFLPRHPAMVSNRPTAICSRACRVCLAIFKMDDIHKQRINIKFYFKLGKTFRETHEMTKIFYGDQCMSRTHCYDNCLRDLRTDGSQHMMSRVWDSPQCHVTTLMLHKFMKSCVPIVF